MLKGLLVVLVFMTSVACQSQAQALREVALPSGKKVKVIAVGQINFSNDRPALMLKYQTDLKISDAAELRKEVEEIWGMFKADVERAKLTNAMSALTKFLTVWSSRQRMPSTSCTKVHGRQMGISGRRR